MLEHNQKNKFKLLISFIKPHKWKFMLLFICIIATTFSGSLYPYVFGKLVDEVYYVKNMQAFLSVFFLYGMIFLASQLLYLLQNMIWAHLMTKFLFDVRKAIFEKVISYPGSRLSNLYSGDIIYRMGHDTEQFMNFIFLNVFYLVASAFYLALSIFFMSRLNWRLALITLIITPLSVYVSLFFSKKIKIKQRNIITESGVLSSWLFEIIKGMQEIKLLSSPISVALGFTKKFTSITRMKIKSNKTEVISERVNSGITLIAQLILYSLSVFFIHKGELTIGGFTACIAYFGKAITSFTDFNGYITGFFTNTVGIERVGAVLSESIEVNDINIPPITITDGSIEFSNVTFMYDNKNTVLNSLSFTIKPGEITALVGRSGAGKSTIVNLLLRFYDIQNGRILIDNFNIAECNLHSLRSQLGIVYQETILFSESIRYNLDFHGKYTDAEILNALKRSHLYDFIISLPEGLNTIIGTGGFALSGGQKQRLAIARIFLKNPKVLIFDETKEWGEIPADFGRK